MKTNIIDLAQRVSILERRLKNTLARGELKGLTNGKTAKAKVSLLEGETCDGLEYPQQFGFISNPPSGSEVVAAFFGGNRDHGTVLAVFNKNNAPINLAGGESAIYNVSGSSVHLKANGDISIACVGGTIINVGNDGNININASVKIIVDCPEVHMLQDLRVDGTIIN